MGFLPNLFQLQFDAAVIIILAQLECGPLPPLLNGQIHIENGKATYICDLGFTLIGKEFRICDLSNKWSGSQPFCEGMAHDYCMIACLCGLFNSKSQTSYMKVRACKFSEYNHAISLR